MHMASVHLIPATPFAQPVHATRKRLNSTPTCPTFTPRPGPRSRTLSGYSYRAASTPDGAPTYSYTPAPEWSSTHSAKQNLRTKPARETPSPVSSSSGKSVRWSDVDDCVVIGNHQRYSPNATKFPSKPLLLARGTMSPPSIADKDTQVIKDSATKDSSLAVGEILHDFLESISKFKCPSELDFFVYTGSPLILADVEKNKPFIKLRQKLDGLQAKLAGISTQGEEYVEKKHAAAGAAINAALEKMKQQQLKLYEQFIGAALDDLTINLNACVKRFEYPSELDFATNSEDGRVLADTERNRPFIAQLCRLDQFQQELNKIPIYGNEELEDRRRAIGIAIERANLKLKKHQREVIRCRNRM